MKRLHIHVSVSDIPQSVEFYSTLFAVSPTVIKPDYAKWMLDDPQVNFAISNRAGGTGLDHLGIQVETQEELHDVYGRLQKADAPVLEEGATICCYAKSEKSWINDPQGLSWETFLTSGESTVYGDSVDLGSIRSHSEATLRYLEKFCDMSCSPLNVLFLCTGHAARSILTESILNHWGKVVFGVARGQLSQGGDPSLRLEAVALARFATDGLRSKSWDEFVTAKAPVMDLSLTVCDQAAGASCPVWPGQPITAH